MKISSNRKDLPEVDGGDAGEPAASASRSGSLCRIELFGGLRVYRGGETITRFRTHKSASLLAYLALHLNETHPRTRLVDLFWPDLEVNAARDNLSTALGSLRRQLEPAGTPAGTLLLADRPTVRLNATAITTDVADLEDLWQAVLRCEDPARELGLLERALALYRGEFLAGSYEDWAMREQRRYAERHCSILLRWSAARESCGDPEGALDAASQAIAADPTLEAAYRRQMHLMARLGRPALALQTYQALVNVLKEQLGAEPEPETRRLAESLRRDAPVGITARRRMDAPTSRVLRVVRAAAVETRTAEVAPRPDLPLTLTPCFGRERELADLERLLCAEGVRLVTLLGPGGVGKTRLAVEAAHRLAPAFEERVWFVSLAEIPEAGLIPMTLARALRCNVTDMDPLEGVARALEGRPCLLVLDNMEHLLRPAQELKGDPSPGGGGSFFVRLLLRSLPRLACLVTSQIALRLDGEQEYPVSPLALPEEPGAPEQLLASPSVALYTSRARAAKPDFGLTAANAGAVAALCRRLEGMPLAIEMAAAWAKTLPAARVLERMGRQLDLLVSHRRDLPPRQQSLRATIEWSYALLAPPLRQLFCGLSIFRGGWTAEMAEAACGDDALNGLAELLEHSLILAVEQEDEVRFRMLEPLREFAAERLAELGEEDRLRRAAAEWLLELALAAGERLSYNDACLWLARLDAERDNLRAALAWCRKEAPDLGMRLAASLARYWELRSSLVEGLAELEAFLNLTAGDAPTPERTRGLCGAGLLAFLQADYPRATAHFGEALTSARQRQDRQAEAAARHGLGNIAFYEQSYDEARAHYEAALELRRQLGDPVALAASHHSLGNVEMRLRRYETAQAHMEQAVRLRREVGNRQTLGMTLGGLGQLAYERGDPEAAHRFTLEALNAFDETGLRWCCAIAFNFLAGMAHDLGRPDRAARLLSVAEAVRKSENTPAPPREHEERERRLARLRADLGREAFDAAWAEGADWTLRQAIDYAANEKETP
jgi:predicted ATPase/DNA-binding SARP family transcriptional activator